MSGRVEETAMRWMTPGSRTVPAGSGMSGRVVACVGAIEKNKTTNLVRRVSIGVGMFCINDIDFLFQSSSDQRYGARRGIGCLRSPYKLPSMGLDAETLTRIKEKKGGDAR